MVQANANLMAEIWERVQTLPSTEKIQLAVRLLQSLDAPSPNPSGFKLTDLIGAWNVDPVPTDEDVERILTEERMRKYGP